MWYTGYNFSLISKGIVYFAALVAIWVVTSKTFNRMLV